MIEECACNRPAGDSSPLESYKILQKGARSLWLLPLKYNTNYFSKIFFILPNILVPIKECYTFKLHFQYMTYAILTAPFVLIGGLFMQQKKPLLLRAALS